MFRACPPAVPLSPLNSAARALKPPALAYRLRPILGGFAVALFTFWLLVLAFILAIKLPGC